MAEWQADHLRYAIDQQSQEHDRLLGQTQAAARSLRVRLQAIQDKRRLKRKEKKEAPPRPPDDSCVRRFVWRIEKVSEVLKTVAHNRSIWSDEFSVLGIEGFKLEFFPNGRESTTVPEFCSLFFWCPERVEVRYQLQVGGRLAAPDEDSYPSKMGHGHSNFCDLKSETDAETDSVELSVTILHIHRSTSLDAGLKTLSDCPEMLVRREAAFLHHRDMNCVEWRIKRATERAASIPRGCSICSPLFSIAGVRQMFLDFYPQGLQATAEEGFCGLYLRCPPGTSLVVTLFVGATAKGPMKAEFDGNSAKGVPSFCRLADAAVHGGDVLVRLDVRNPQAEERDSLKTLEFSS